MIQRVLLLIVWQNLRKNKWENWRKENFASIDTKKDFLAMSPVDISQTGKRVEKDRRQKSQNYSQQSPNDVVGFTWKSSLSPSQQATQNDDLRLLSSFYHLYALAGGKTIFTNFTIFTCCSSCIWWCVSSFELKTCICLSL